MISPSFSVSVMNSICTIIGIFKHHSVFLCALISGSLFFFKKGDKGVFHWENDISSDLTRDYEPELFIKIMKQMNQNKTCEAY